MAESDLVSIVREFLGRGVESHLGAGEVLWREGEAGDEVALLVDGLIEVVHDAAAGEEEFLRIVEAGAVIGETASADGHGRPATVRARTPCRLVRLRAPDFRSLLRQRPDLLEEMYWLQVERVCSLTRAMRGARRRAITDPLTRLYNFGYFRERLEIEVERARLTGDPVSLVMFDVDHFKPYNDAHGHPEGNRVLVIVAEILRRCARRGDVIARYGGEEFVALFYAAPREEAVRYAETVRAFVHGQAFASAGRTPAGGVTVSAGVAVFPDDAGGEERLVEVADRNLYLAKEGGRNRVVSGAGPGGA